MKTSFKKLGVIIISVIMMVGINAFPVLASNITESILPEPYIFSEEPIDMPDINTEISDKLLTGPETRDGNKPTKIYDFAKSGKYSFEYSNTPHGFSRCWSRYKFTNCSSTMYLKIKDQVSSNTSNWYYEVYCNGKSIGNYTCKPGASRICTIKNLKKSDKIWFYIAAGTQTVKGYGSLDNKK
ncbi:MAG: hypothetical protein Q4E24_16940 [bacterium]|nr:hypothetical protein [bacterium]